MLKKSIHFSSEKEDNDKDDESINKYKFLFSDYVKNVPTLSDALNQMLSSKIKENQKVKEFTKEIINKCKSKIDGRFGEIQKKYSNITKEDAYIICSYTCEIDEESQYSPYSILNRNLVEDNRRIGLERISKYFFLLLKSLRKLPRYYPEYGKLYRCIRRQVSLSKDKYNKKLIPYEIGNTKTLWAFTSTSLNPYSTYEFLKEEFNDFKSGTCFTYQGLDLWGYDINLFSYYYPKEEEVLIEPERKIFVDNVLPLLNGIINITCTIIETPLVLKDIIEYNKEFEEKDTHKKNDKSSNRFNFRLPPRKEDKNRFSFKSKNSKPIKIEGNIQDNETKDLIKVEEKQDEKKVVNSNPIKTEKLSFTYDFTNKPLIEQLEEKNLKKGNDNEKMSLKTNQYKRRGRNKISEIIEKEIFRQSYDKPFSKNDKKNFEDNRYDDNNSGRNRNKMKPNYNPSYDENEINKLLDENIRALNNLGFKVNKEDEILHRVLEKSKIEK